MKVQAECQIKASQSEVFEAFSDLHNLAANVKAITKVEILTPGNIGKGTKFKETRFMFGKEATEIMEITEFQPPEFIKEEAHSSGMHYISEWRFTENNGTTTVSITFTGTATTILARILSMVFAFMAGSMKKAFLTDMNDIKNMLENKSNS